MPLLLGFYFQMGSPRTAALTAALVISTPAFVAGGEPFSGAIRHEVSCVLLVRLSVALAHW
ncbi:hypothetical protein OS21_03060 [Dickeya oryzae]